MNFIGFFVPAGVTDTVAFTREVSMTPYSFNRIVDHEFWNMAPLAPKNVPLEKTHSRLVFTALRVTGTISVPGRTRKR
jgi:hypothetical protein